MKKAKPSKSALLRTVLSDGRWHSNSELVRAGVGYRYGAVIFNVRRGKDGHAPLDIEKRQKGPGRWEYRAAKGEP